MMIKFLPLLLVVWPLYFYLFPSQAPTSLQYFPSRAYSKHVTTTKHNKIYKRAMRNLEKFVDELPRPAVHKPQFVSKDLTMYSVLMSEFYQKLHRDLPPTKLWGYESVFPGATFEVRKNERVQIKWINDLPSNHFLPVDTTVHGANHNAPTVRTVTHVHGAVVANHSDGHPEAWFTANFAKTGPRWTRPIYEYTNHQNATTLIYHDHALGITRLNVYAGLVGFYLIRDEYEETLNLPKGEFEIPLLISDRSFNDDGSLFYPTGSGGEGEPTPSVVPEYYADTILVNGKVWPYLRVEPRKYRFRIVNGCNSRLLNLTLSSGQPFYQIGTSPDYQ